MMDLMDIFQAHSSVNDPGLPTNALNVEEVMAEDLTEKDVIVALVGPTGSGKSNFISLLTGHNECVGHTLDACTSDIKAFRVSMSFAPKALRLVLIDTPGFNDMDPERETALFKRLLEWMRTSKITVHSSLKIPRTNISMNIHWEDQKYLDGLLYLHRIVDNRTSNDKLKLKNIKYFFKLCGEAALSNFFFVTTMWDLEEEEMAREKENTLIEEDLFWKVMKSFKANVRRFGNNSKDAWAILHEILLQELRRREARIQKELGALRKVLGKNGGQELQLRIEGFVQQQKDLIGRISGEMTSTPKNLATISALKVDYDGLRRTRDHALKHMMALENNALMKQFRRMWMFAEE